MLEVSSTIMNAIAYIEAQLDEGYLDVSELHDKTEMEILRVAIKEYKTNHCSFY